MTVQNCTIMMTVKLVNNGIQSVCTTSIKGNSKKVSLELCFKNGYRIGLHFPKSDPGRGFTYQEGNNLEHGCTLLQAIKKMSLFASSQFEHFYAPAKTLLRVMQLKRNPGTFHFCKKEIFLQRNPRSAKYQ